MQIPLKYNATIEIEGTPFKGHLNTEVQNQGVQFLPAQNQPLPPDRPIGLKVILKVPEQEFEQEISEFRRCNSHPGIHWHFTVPDVTE